MDKEILNALLQMIQSGGQIAVWGIVAYWGMQLLALTVKGGIIWGCLGTLSGLVRHCWDNYQQCKASRVSLLSDKVTGDITQVFSTLSSEISSLAKELRTQLEELRESAPKQSKSNAPQE